MLESLCLSVPFPQSFILFCHLDLLPAPLCSLVLKLNTNCFFFLFLNTQVSSLCFEPDYRSVWSPALLCLVVWFKQAVIFHSRHLRGLQSVVWGESYRDPSPLLLSLLVRNHHYASRICAALILRNQCSLESPALQEEAQNNLMSDASLWYSYLKPWQKYKLFHAQEPPQVYGDDREPQMHFD